MKKILLLFIFLAYQFNVLAQQDAWIYFIDKENVAASIANPISILTQKAIDRKNAHNIVIDKRDVPVNENYIAQLKAKIGITVMAKSKWFNAVHVRGTKANIEDLESLTIVDSVYFADKNLNTSRTFHKNNNKFETESIYQTFNYGNALNQIEMFNGDKLHLANYTGQGITVAVIDAGFPNVNTMAAFQRLRDAGNILDDYDFVNRDDDVYTNTTSNHGTLVLSDMAGYVENKFVGTAPDASYYLFITEDAPNENPVEESYWVEAAERADSLGVDIINTSLGYKNYDNANYSYTSADLNGNTAFITKGANIAFKKGMLLVNSAGNSGASGVGAPADAVDVFSIGAVDADGNYTSFSSQGSSFQPTQKPDVVAQGRSSYVITENDIITTSNGTSFSSPIMAGGIACLWQALPTLTNAEIMQLIRESASQYNTPDNFLGYGIPDLQLALNNGTLLVETQEQITKFGLYPNPVLNEIIIKIPIENESVSFAIFDVLGKLVFQKTVNNSSPKVNISDLSSGIYIAKLEALKTSKTIRLIKK